MPTYSQIKSPAFALRGENSENSKKKETNASWKDNSRSDKEDWQAYTVESKTSCTANKKRKK